MLEIIFDEFILKEISLKIVTINQNSRKRNQYGANLNIKYDENDLEYIAEIDDIENTSLFSG